MVVVKAIKENWFFLGLFIVILVALKFPFLGIGIKPYLQILIFISMFLIGLKQDLLGLFMSMKNYKAISLCLLASFILMPLLSYLLGLIFFQNNQSYFIGIILAGAVATTQGSSIIWTDMSKGNTNLALILMAVSNVLGIFLMPVILLISLGSSINLPVFNIIGTLLLVILLPVVLAQITKRFVRYDFSKIDRISQIANIIIIWLIVLTALVNPEMIGWGLLLIVLVVIIQYCIIALLTYYGSRFIGLNKKDSIAVMFCSSQKTITVAAVIGFAYFDALSTIYILVYHIFQQIMGQVTAKIL